MERVVEKNEQLAQIKDSLSGCFAGFCSRLVEYPFDTIKVIYQTEHIKSNFWEVVLKLFKEEGVFRIYRGLSAPLLGSTIENLIIFWFFGFTERFLKNYYGQSQLSLSQIAICGAVAGMGAGTWLTPVEYIKCRMQARHTTGLYTNTLNCIVKTIQTNPLHLFNGFSATITREILGNGIFFVTYRGTTRVLQKTLYPNDYYEKKDPKSWIILLGGSCAGLSYWSLIYPFDLAKSRIQTTTHDTIHIAVNRTTLPSNNFINTTTTTTMPIITRVPLWTFLYNHTKRYGIKSLYSGMSVTIPRAIICNAITFSAYEYSRNFLNKFN